MKTESHTAMGVARAIKVGDINEYSLATPPSSMKILHYPLPTRIFTSILRKSRVLSWQNWGLGQFFPKPSLGQATACSCHKVKIEINHDVNKRLLNQARSLARTSGVAKLSWRNYDVQNLRAYFYV